MRRSFDSVFGFKLVDQRDFRQHIVSFSMYTTFQSFGIFTLFFLEVVLSGVLYY